MKVVPGSRFQVSGFESQVQGLRLSVLSPQSFPKSKIQSPKTNSELRTPNPKGFTLLEILVAGAILSMVLAILYGVFSQTLTSKQRAEEQSAQSRAARIVLLRIGDDLQASFPFAPDNPRFVGKTSRGQQFPDAFLSFVSLSGLPLTSGSPAGDWYEIEYELVPDPHSAPTRQLVRRARFAPTALGAPASQTNEGETLPLLTGVQGLRLRFFDGRIWHEEWGKESTPAKLPRAVEVELYLVRKKTGTRHQEEETVMFSTLVDLPLVGTGAPQLGGST